MGKYDPLANFLSQAPAHLNTVVVSFKQVELIIGRTLPPNAYNPKGTWWRNTRSVRRPQAHAWLSVGWKQDIVSWQSSWVRFRRER